MHTYCGTANKLYPQLVQDVMNKGHAVGPRGTRTRELNPVMIELLKPWERLVTSVGRPINVTFALAEVLWILQGRRDVPFLSWFNKSIERFSDDGRVFQAPYGYRLRSAHGYDQIEDAVLTLTDDRDSRQATLVIWHPNDRGWYHDPELRTLATKRLTKDRACNVLAHMMIRNDKLDWLQIVRSNDLLLGVPYNWMQWVSMQEYFANRLEVGMGKFTYIADSLHLYEDTYYKEVPNMRPFDLYQHAGAPHVMDVHRHQLDAAEKEIDNIRLREEWHDLDLSPFWDRFQDMAMAHLAYRNHEDDTTVRLLLDRADVYSVAQLRFYWAKRWKKMKTNSYLADPILQRLPERSAYWIIRG